MQFDYALEPGKFQKIRYRPEDVSPQISVITPAYNAWAWLEQTKISLLNQTFPWFEWIVVDDGSDLPLADAYWDQLLQCDCRIRVLHQENQGAAAARNHGIRESRTKYVFFLDADDLIDERYLECAFWALQCNRKAMWAYGDSIGFQEQRYVWRHEFSSEAMKVENLLPYACLIRKEVFANPENYPNRNGNMWEDYQLWLRLLAQGYFPAHIAIPLFWYRRTADGALSKIAYDKPLKRVLKKEIKQLAHSVPNGIRAITFGGKRVGEFQKPRVWEYEPVLPYAEEKTRILLLLPHMECGGADKFNLDIIKHMDRSRYEIGIITTVPAENEWRQEFQKYADDIFELPAFLDMNDWASFIHYYIATRQVNILWNISSYFGYYTLPWLRLEFPTLAIIDCVHAEGQYWRSGGYPRVSSAVDSVLEKTFVTNDFTRNVMVEKYGKPREKTQVIYTGVDEREFIPDAVDGAQVRQQHGLGERLTVLFLCRMAAEKRPFLMLEVARQVHRKNPNICFLVVGGGPQLEELKAKAKDLEDTIYFTGRVQDTKPYYSAADLFLLTSIKEGLSITTMEAMLMELPVISADVGSQYELVDARTGQLIPCRQDEAKDFDSRSFPNEEINDYVSAILEYAVSRDKCRTAGVRCRKKMLDGYTLQTMVKTLDKEFTLLSSAEATAQRIAQAQCLQPLRGILTDYMVLYQTYENKDMEAAEIWRAREWYRTMYEQSQKEEGAVATFTPLIPSDGTEAERILRDIYQMRSWRIIQKYRNFMDNTGIGRFLRKIRNIFRRTNAL